MKFIRSIFKPIDLTEGKPWKVILLFAIPILLSTLLNNAFSLINALVLKITVGGTSVTSINQTGSIPCILFNFAYGCSSGFAVIISNKFGSKDYEGLKKTFFNSIILLSYSFILITASRALSKALPNKEYISDSSIKFNFSPSTI